jgi:RND family efflux transporter MFP subunit
MTPRKSSYLSILIPFLLGAALTTAVVWNPARWQWADGLIRRLHSPETESKAEKKEGRIKYWQAPMDPSFVSDKPGKSPMGIDLVPVYEDEEQDSGASKARATPETGERKVKYWRAPMNPDYISDKPGKSPMGMDLVPVYEDEETTQSGIRVDLNFLQNFSVRTAVVEKGSLPIEIRTIGILALNQKNIVAVNTKIEGWIEKAKVNYLGEPVRHGEVLFEIYSPQLVTTQQEYLAAIDYEGKLSSGGDFEAFERAKSLLAATEDRLRYWDIDSEQITELKNSRKITRTVKVRSPISGVVIAKMADSLEGMKLTPGMNVYKIADLSTVWAEIEVFEYQIQYLRLGQMAKITLDAFPGRSWKGRIIYLEPAVNQKTRTLKADVEIANPDLELRPGMYANVKIRLTSLSSVVKIPEEAILHSGERNIVIVELHKGLFEPREVELGVSGAGYQEVRHGLSPGEVVVTSSQFLIDSESNLKEAIQKILVGRKGDSDKNVVTAPAHEH